jgi:uncharacterized membrane protein YhaH (DUF805 family)
MGVPGPSIGGFLRGRASRREYWVMVAIVLLLSLTASYIVPAVQTGGVVAITFAQIRRLHDLGRTGWWIAAMVGLQLLLAGAAIVLELPDESLELAIGLLTLLPIVLLGALPGQPMENRFGPPPGRRSLKEIFS